MTLGEFRKQTATLPDETVLEIIDHPLNCEVAALVPHKEKLFIAMGYEVERPAVTEVKRVN